MTLTLIGFNCIKFFVPHRLLNLSARCNIEQSVKKLVQTKKPFNKVRYDEFP